MGDSSAFNIASWQYIYCSSLGGSYLIDGVHFQLLKGIYMNIWFKHRWNGLYILKQQSVSIGHTLAWLIEPWPKQRLDHIVSRNPRLTHMENAFFVFMVAAFGCGTVFGALLTFTCSRCMNIVTYLNSHAKKEKIQKCPIPSAVWITRAGTQFHLQDQCGSLKLDGLQRKGVVQFKICSHCLKQHCSDSHL